MGRKNNNALKGAHAKPSKVKAMEAKEERERLSKFAKAHKAVAEFYTVSSHLSEENQAALSKYKMEVFGK